MRPRRARLGCVAGNIDDPSAHAIRFNEAEARAPRMLDGTSSATHGDTGFNEAEARAPRMLVPAHRNASRCFNEAEARAPRMR